MCSDLVGESYFPRYHERVNWVRPLIRYVDSDLAVVEAHVFLRRSAADPQRGAVDVLVRVDAPDGRSTVVQRKIEPDADTGLIRFELKSPQRWWPAGMGEQPLYRMSVTILASDRELDSWATTIGLTSVRPLGRGDRWLVNSVECPIQSVVPVRPVDEAGLLAVGGQSLLLVRDHVAPEVLCEAADRAGILLVQSLLPGVQRQVDRLAAHPSLAGWFVDPASHNTQRLEQSVRALDPTRKVLRTLPLAG